MTALWVLVFFFMINVFIFFPFKCIIILYCVDNGCRTVHVGGMETNYLVFDLFSSIITSRVFLSYNCTHMKRVYISVLLCVLF